MMNGVTKIRAGSNCETASKFLRLDEPPALDRMRLTRQVWFDRLMEIAKAKAQDSRFVADAGCSSTGLLEVFFTAEWPSEKQPVLGVGIDNSAKAVGEAQNRAREKHLPLVFLRGDLEFLESMLHLRFGIIFCWEVLYLLPKHSLRVVLTNLSKLLLPNGVLMLGTTCPRTAGDVNNAYFSEIQKRLNPPGISRIEADYLRLLEGIGLEVESQRIRFTSKEYNRLLAHVPAQEMWFPSEDYRRLHYIEWGKAVWLCTSRGRFQN